MDHHAFEMVVGRRSVSMWLQGSFTLVIAGEDGCDESGQTDWPSTVKERRRGQNQCFLSQLWIKSDSTWNHRWAASLWSVSPQSSLLLAFAFSCLFLSWNVVKWAQHSNSVRKRLGKFWRRLQLIHQPCCNFLPPKKKKNRQKLKPKNKHWNHNM